MNQTRLLYPDICKFVAIFIVTCSHCAQYISGQTWTNFIGGTYLDIAFNMPLFMIISGWFINTDKMKKENALNYLSGKFKRLILPSITWYFIYCIISINMPTLGGIATFYWYLNALFVSLLILFMFVKLIKNDIICALVSSLFVIVCPFLDIAHINFMFPYIWSGVFLRKLFDNHNPKLFVIICAVIGIVLSFYWTPDHTVYRAPFKIFSADSRMVCMYVYRFVIGFTISSVIIYLIKTYENSRILKPLAKYGKYSLIIYTFSFVVNGLISRILNYFNIHTNEYVLLDFLSILLCIAIVIATVKLSNLCNKNKYTKLFLLGE